jgi:hypothetical protein
MSKFPNIVAYSVPGANYTGKPKKMFPHGFTARYQVLGNIDKLVSIVYYCGKRGYKFSYKEIERLGIKGFDITISLGSQRQFTYFKKRFN